MWKIFTLISVHGCTHNFFILMLKEPIRNKKNSNIGHAPIESPVSTPAAKQKFMCSFRYHLFSLYTWELNFGQTIWDKIEVLLGTSYGTYLGTWWEHISNKEFFKNNHFPLLPSLKKIKAGLFMSACWAFPFTAWSFSFKAVHRCFLHGLILPFVRTAIPICSNFGL
jgi:hypothetical protein